MVPNRQVTEQNIDVIVFDRFRNFRIDNPHYTRHPEVRNDISSVKIPNQIFSPPLNRAQTLPREQFGKIRGS